MTIQERRAKLVDETVEYYLTHPRNRVGGLCCYYREIDGKVRKCAIGRLLDDEVARALSRPNFVLPKIVKNSLTC